MKIRPDASSGFRIHKVSFHGAAGAVVAICAVAVLVEGVPSLRGPYLISLVAGGLVGVGLVLYHRWSLSSGTRHTVGLDLLSTSRTHQLTTPPDGQIAKSPEKRAGN